MPLPKDLLDLLVCPFCRGELDERGDSLACRSAECGLVYPVRDGIPVMLIDEAARECPGCRGSRELKDDILSCAKCGRSLKAAGAGGA